MTANGPSLQPMPAEEPCYRRPNDDAHLRPTTRTTPPTTLESNALRWPRRSMHGVGEARLPVDTIIARRQPHQFGRSRPSTNAKSP